MSWTERLVEQRSTVKLLFDENLSPNLKGHLADLFPGSVHVRDIGLTGAPDSAIWEHAKVFNLAILTKDRDFAEFAGKEGPPPTVIQIRTGNCSVAKLETLIRERSPEIMLAVQYGKSLLEITFEREAAVAETPAPE